MIWFQCKQCGKTHGRPETAGGSLVFCECGQGNQVPWESTAPQPENPLPVAVPMPVPPKLEPLSFNPEIPPETRGRTLAEPSYPGRRSRGRRRFDPNYCLNHEASSSQKTCSDCGEAFCSACFVMWRNQPWCGPCKNFRIRALQRPPILSTLAVISVILAMLTAVLSVCLLLIIAQSLGSPWLGLLALVPHGVALGLGFKALRDTETNPKISGRGLAITGVLTSLVASFLTIILTITGP